MNIIQRFHKNCKNLSLAASGTNALNFGDISQVGWESDKKKEIVENKETGLPKIESPLLSTIAQKWYIITILAFWEMESLTSQSRIAWSVLVR